MPTALQEAFKSPYHKSNPASQFYNLSSYTRPSTANSIRQELENSDFNNYYYLGGLKNNQNNKNSNCLPQYQPPNAYPTLHPTKDHTSANWLPSYQPKKDNDTDSSGSIDLRNINLSSEQAVSHTPSYLTGKPPPPNFCPPNSTTPNKHQDDNSYCQELISQVLGNQKCRHLLKKILLDDSNEIENFEPQIKRQPKKNVVEGFATNNNLDHTTIKTILIYSLGGLLLLCVFDFCFKLGQILTKKHF